MRAGNAFSELSNNKPNSSINKTINTRNNKTSSRIDLEQTDTQNRLDWMEKRRLGMEKGDFYKPTYKTSQNSWYRRVYKIREFLNYCVFSGKFETLNHISEPVRK